MRIAIVTDAWLPQINGVVRTLGKLCGELEKRGHEICLITPSDFRTLPCPSYPEIRLAVMPGRGVRKALDDFAPEAIHVSTEGPLGLAGRRYCVKHGFPFSTSYHTRFPEYLSARVPVPLSWGYAFMRWFHAPSSSVMVATETVRQDLKARGFTNIKEWSRGVDTDLFRPRNQDILGLPKPVFLYVGRVAVEKNIDAFLDLDLPGSKAVVGDGPQLQELRRRFPEVHFVGAKTGEDLALHYAASDVFVFPSRTDTFGLVMLEALASGLPVAAYPVPGPLDVINGHKAGILNENLEEAARGALRIPSDICREYALEFSWRGSVEQFLEALRPFR